jgi:hypothetical protein
VLVDQETHEFGRGERRMGVVEMNGPLVRQQGPVAVAGAKRGQQVLHRGGDEEMLLAQPEFTSLRRAVVGIEDARQGLAVHLAGLGVEMGPAVEGAEIEGVDRLDAPQPQRVDRGMVVPGHKRVVGHGKDILGLHPVGAKTVVLHAPAEADAIGALGAQDLPGIGLVEPAVRLLDLPAVGDLLAEHAVFIADAVADAGQPDAGGGVEKAGGEPPQPAIAERRAGLDRHEFVELDAVAGQRGAAFIDEPCRHQRVLELARQQKLHRQVGHLLQALVLHDAVGVVPAPHETVANRQRGRPEPVALARLVRRHAQGQREAFHTASASAGMTGGFWWIVMCKSPMGASRSRISPFPSAPGSLLSNCRSRNPDCLAIPSPMIEPANGAGCPVRPRDPSAPLRALYRHSITLREWLYTFL